jgi:methanogenic corrinoid protein MtbC1
MNIELALERLLQLAVSGDRDATRAFIEQASMHGATSESLATDLYWPAMQATFKFWRQDQMSALAYRYATRILRMLVDQAQVGYTRAPRNGRRLLCICGPDESEDLAGQLCADLLEASGYEVLFAGGGVANDEILAEVGQRRPDALVVFAASAADAPRIRALIDSIREVGAHPSLPIVCGGGVFARAPGLAEEIGADATADDPLAVERMVRCALASPRAVAPVRSANRARAAVA